MTTVVLEPRLAPGEMEVVKERNLAGGYTLRFELAPAGWLTKQGKPRLSDWRAYYRISAAGKRERLPSVSTFTGALCPPALAWWGEEHGIRGCCELVRRGEWNPQTNTDDDAVQRVRALKLGQDAARDRAADRGLNVHALLEEWARTGEFSDPGEHPPEHQGFIQGLARWVVHADPEPMLVEHLVYSSRPGVAYAGRLDLLASVNGELTLVDLKTNPRGQIYTGAHLQARAYARALKECGDPVPERVVIVAVSQDGRFREMDCQASETMLDRALGWYELYARLDGACMGQNRAHRRDEDG